MGASHFDAKAAGWDLDEAKIARAAEVADAVAAHVPLTPEMRLLEYGAGTGLVTQALAGRVGPATLADSSAGMREVIQQKIDAGALPGARLWELDLENQPARDEQFDLVLTSLVLHHIHHLDRVLAGFADLLRPGCYVAIADLDQEAGTFHGHDFDGHHGFDRTELAARLGAAGFVDVTVEDCTEILRDDVPYTVFLAVGRRPGPR